MVPVGSSSVDIGYNEKDEAGLLVREAGAAIGARDSDSFETLPIEDGPVERDEAGLLVGVASVTNDVGDSDGFETLPTVEDPAESRTLLATKGFFGEMVAGVITSDDETAWDGNAVVLTGCGAIG